MLEMLLILSALGGNQESFNKSSEAYYKYQKIDKTIEKISKENPILAQTVAAIGLSKEKRLYYQISGPWYHEINAAADGFKTIAYWKKEF